MQTKFAAKRVGTLNKFFTRISVGQILVEQVEPALPPKKILDLGAGEGSLSVAAVKRWPSTSVVTVDIDPTTSERLTENLEQAGCSEHRHSVQDVLRPELVDEMEEKYGLFDVAVCNPPFFNPTWCRTHADILQRAGLEDACSSVSEVTAELLFIAQSLSLLKDGGCLAVIVPDSVVTTKRAMNFRKTIISKFSVEKIFQLPINSFFETDAQCFIMIIRKGVGSTENISLLNVEGHAVSTETVTLAAEDAVRRMDYNYHSLMTQHTGIPTSLRELGADVIRGNISTVQRKTADFPVFHTSDYDMLNDGRIELPDESNLNQFAKVIAEKGDILLARVDRNLHEKIGQVTKGSAVLTDCVYRIRLPFDHQDKAFSALCSPEGRKNLQALTKGVGARIIGKADLLDMPLFVDLD